MHLILGVTLNGSFPQAPGCSRRLRLKHSVESRIAVGTANRAGKVPSRCWRPKKALEDCGGKIVQRIWSPIGTKDFGPYIPTIRSDVDGVFTLMVGPMSLPLPKQLRAAAFTKPVLGRGTSYDEFILPAMGQRNAKSLYVGVPATLARRTDRYPGFELAGSRAAGRVLPQ